MGDSVDREGELATALVQIASKEQLRGLVLPAQVDLSPSDLTVSVEKEQESPLLPLHSKQNAEEFMCEYDSESACSPSKPAAPRQSEEAIQFMGSEDSETVTINVEFENEGEGCNLGVGK